MFRRDLAPAWIAIVFIAGMFLLGQDAWSPCEVVSFPDPNLEEAIRFSIGRPEGNICSSDLLSLTTLEASVLSITDISGLENCVMLTHVELHTNQISDIGPLAALDSLEYLELDDNQISDIGPLAGLVALSYLVLSNNQISDTSALAGLTNLVSLNLTLNQVSDINPLAALTSLSNLYLFSNQITDIYPLLENAGIDSGDWVNLGANPLSEVSCTEYVPELESRGVSVPNNCP